MKTKRIITCIISCIMFMMCIPFTAIAEDQSKECVFMCYWSNWLIEYHNIPFANIPYSEKITFVDANNYTYEVTCTEDVDLFKLYQNAEKVVSSGPSGKADMVAFMFSSPVPIANGSNQLYTQNYKMIYGLFGLGSKIGVSTYATCNGKTLLENRPFIYEGDVLFSCDIVLNTNGFTISDYQSFQYIKSRIGDDITYDISNANISTVEEENTKLKEQLNNPYTGYITIEQNNGTAAERFPVTVYPDGRTETTEEFQNYINSLNVKVDQLISRINILSTGTYGDVNGDEVADVQDAQIILKYYTMKDVAGIEVPDLVTFGMNFGKE